jgi:hypothetical protein
MEIGYAIFVVVLIVVGAVLTILHGKDDENADPGGW